MVQRKVAHWFVAVSLVLASSSTACHAGERLTGLDQQIQLAVAAQVAGLQTARLLLAAGEARACLVCLGDWLPPLVADAAGVAPATALGVILLESIEPCETALATLDELCAASARAPLAQLASLLDRSHE